MLEFLKLYLLIFIASFTITVLITKPVVVFAKNFGIVDRPGNHKTHTNITPLLGGVSIFIAIMIVMLFYSIYSIKLLSILIGSLVVVMTGLYDDIYCLKPFQKMAGQIVAAAIIVFPNTDYLFYFKDLFNGFNIPFIVLQVLIIGWVVLMINSFNIIDGLDGLASGTAAIIFASMAIINYISWGSEGMMWLQIAGAGACLGFLYYNFQPARIFMGDTGSMLIGFILSASFIFSLRNVTGGALVLGSLFIFAYPTLDISFAILRRIRRRSSIFKADQGHIHHILLSMGFSVRKTVVIIYLISMFFSVLAFILLCINLTGLTVLIIGIITIFATLFAYRYLQIISLQNGVDLPKEIE